jgi:hypothetical protein
MKTLSEGLKEHAAVRESFREAELRRCRELWERSAGLQPYQPPNPQVDVTNYAAFRTKIRDWLAAGEVELYELACDHCKTQLVNHEPGVVLTSSPPRKRAACPGCGWVGSVPFGVR